jgi:hypothetical protein
MAVIVLNIGAPNIVTAVGNGLSGGHVIVDPGERMDWKNATATSSRREFLVAFYDDSQGTKVPVWPVNGQTVPAGSTCTGPNGMTWLKVPASGVRFRLAATSQPSFLKYDVHVAAQIVVGSPCAPDTGFVSLDPMIIIKTRSSGINVAFGVTCAVLGAVAAALAMALLY